jgi:hypothetical protein
MKLGKEAAIFGFFSSFGVQAFEQNSVPDGKDRPEYPYITYELKTGRFSEYDTSVIFSIWDDNNSIERLIGIAKSIASYLGRMGKVIKIDDGYILIMADNPFCEIGADEAIKTVKRARCSLKMRFYTNT